MSRPAEPAPVWPEAPRHGPDRPFPARRFVPGTRPHPRGRGGTLEHEPAAAPGLPADRWREDESFLRGVDLYHRGYLWEAHEAWEACYFAARDAAHRTLLQALIQLAAAVLQAHCGRGAGVRILARSVERRLRRVADAVPAGARLAGVDPRDVLAQVVRHFASALTEGPDPAATVGPAPRLELERDDPPRGGVAAP